jgi:hypothetical protein
MPFIPAKAKANSKYKGKGEGMGGEGHAPSPSLNSALASAYMRNTSKNGYQKHRPYGLMSIHEFEWPYGALAPCGASIVIGFL